MKQHVVIPAFISPDEADSLVAHARDANSEYRTHRGGNAYCTVAWISTTHPGYQRLSERIMEVARLQNDERFKLGALADSFPQYQYTDYHEAGDAYGWHSDSAPHIDYLAARRLTVSITLTDASEHGGGGFELSDHVGHTTESNAAALYESMQSLSDEEKEMLGKKGTLIIFPSNRMHRALPLTSGTRKILVCWIPCPPLPAAVPPLEVEAAPEKPAQDTSRLDVFTRIWRDNSWNCKETRSGPGSAQSATAGLRQWLPATLKFFGVEILADAGCGDMNWMRELTLPLRLYLGSDIVPELVADVRERMKDRPNCYFTEADIVTTTLARSDAILCRDVLTHLPLDDVMLALKQFRKSGSRYLIATTHTVGRNAEINCGDWQALDLTAAPFNLPPPRLTFQEGGAKHLAVWASSDLPE